MKAESTNRNLAHNWHTGQPKTLGRAHFVDWLEVTRPLRLKRSIATIPAQEIHQDEVCYEESVYWLQWMIVLTSAVVAGMSVVSGETFPVFFAEQHPALAGQTVSASGAPALHGIADSGRNADLRWPDFTPYKAEVAKLYEMNVLFEDRKQFRVPLN